MTVTLQPPRGTHDILPEQARRFRHVEETALRVFKTYGFGEIRTPTFEHTDVFARTAGDTTDIVTKEMYTFEDRGGDSLTLRPEGTAGVVRAYYSNGLRQNLPLKVCYVGAAMFRYERPQKGRLREHHQVGIEIFGHHSATADVEAILVGFSLLKALGLDQGLYVQLNSLGTVDCRQKFRAALMAYLQPMVSKLSAESQDRLIRNPLRILDTKDEGDRALLANAPKIEEFLSPEAAIFAADVRKGLEMNGIPYQVNPYLVRGLDYYSHTVFEIHSDRLGAQSQIISGGRYNGLFAQMGGDDVPAVGFGSGVERLESLLAEIPADEGGVMFAVRGDKANLQIMPLARRLREQGITVHVPLDAAPPAFKNQFSKANKLKVKYCVVVGEEELATGVYQLKDMTTGIQESLPATQVVDRLVKELGGHA